MRRAALTCVFFALVGSASLPAHPEIEAALARLNARLLAAPADAAAYLERGELYLRHEDWLSAEANFLVAAELAPALPRLARARGALALARREPAAARAFLDAALERDPADHEARALRARAAVAQGDLASADRDYAAVIDALPSPAPELVLAHLALLPPDAALVRLGQVLTRIGPVHVLQLRALELEEATGRIDAALVRLDRLAADSERKEHWLRRRGDLLARHRRPAEARRAYSDALAAVLALPDWLRDSPATRRLISELQLAATPAS